MKLTEENKQSMLHDLNVIQQTIKLTVNNCVQIKELDEWIDNFNQLKNQFTAPDNSLKPTHYFAKAATSSLSNLGELINLLRDLYQGKVNTYLQEALNNAELSVAITPKDKDDPHSRKTLTINIQIAATVIDKYAHLLEIILGQNNVSTNQQALVLDAYNNLIQFNDRLEKLKQSRFCTGFKNLLTEAEYYIKLHNSRACCFGMFKNKPSQQYYALINWFFNLSEQPLSAHELAGAIYAIRDQISKINSAGERDAIRDSLDKLLKDNDYPMYSKQNTKDLFKQYIQPFIKQADTLSLAWPASFTSYANEVKSFTAAAI
ncbi:Uncharacterised protein [Legionella beliardensis]|uniref:Uncharacterized protein n=1 Tax=Legionella beliardensis TaxID=91822 RepID=A0A378HYB8_9GAMM|nr:hypothetical protein [Legionella beliardensis]STX27887.1 Uncharacterised protein [Legionella beliardensis]